MFSFLCASFIVSVASVVSVSAAPSLTAEVSTLNEPRGVLSSFHKDSFSITNDADSRPSFNDAKIKFSPAYAANLGDRDAFTILDPGARIDVTRGFSDAHNFAPPGPGEYLITPSNRFIHVDGDGTPKDLFATVEDTAKDTLSGDIAVSRVRNKRDSATDQCSDDQKTRVNAAVAEAQNLVTIAAGYVLDASTHMDLYTAWFGTWDPDYANMPLSHFALMGSNRFKSLTYHCTCTDSFRDAYADADHYGDIYLCPSFWNLPTSGLGSMGGVFIREAVRFRANGYAQNYTYYSQTDAASLASNFPALAIKNADNHRYFAEST